jgi:N-acetylmuramoyl-L-alanine amidase
VSLRIALDRQHAGKERRPKDLGASADLDGDGRKSIHETEAMLTPFIALAAELRLRELGHTVYAISDGEYADRHDRVNSYGVDVYIALHLNAGAGRKRGWKPYSAVFYDFRSDPDNGKRLAESIDRRLGGIEAIGSNRRVWATAETGWKRNPHYTIRGVRGVAICLEPLFIDHPQHQQQLTAAGLEAVGHALANGIHDWHKARKQTADHPPGALS